MTDLVDSIFEIFEESDLSPKDTTEEIQVLFKNKGYGNRTEELSFLKNFFSRFFEVQYHVFQIDWNQYQDYNDNWYYYDLHDVKINQYINAFYFSFDNEDESWNYHLDIPDSGDKSKNNDKLKRELKILRNQIDKVFCLLKALDEYYGGYYFIYVFGSRAKISISKDGISIDKEDIEL